MNTWIKEIDGDKRKKALEIMSQKRLIFLLNKPESIEKLKQYVKVKNKILYGVEDFDFIMTDYEKNLIIAAVPDLGPGQLGTFAGRNFETGEIVAIYLGKDLWGELPQKVMKNKIAKCDDSGDYFWEVVTRPGYSKAIDSKLQGSAARFVNDSLQRNVDIVTIDGTLCYKARKPIKFGEEITATYGDTYFSYKHPRIEYTPKSLQSILGIMLQNSNDLSSIRFENIDSIQNFLEAMNWNNMEFSNNNNENNNNSEPMEVLFGKKMPQIPETRITSEQKSLYINSKNEPLIFDLSKEGSFAPLSTTTRTQIKKTSDFKLFVAPVGIINNKRKFSLFAGEKITKKSIVCIIDGEHFNKKQFKEKERTEIVDQGVLFDVADNKKIYCKNMGSEALFVQAGDNPQTTNVKLSYTKGIAKYIATKDIEAGCEIVAHFVNYPYTSPPTTLEKVVDAFNANQLIWDAFLTEEENESYTLTMSAHCMTPGRDPENNNDYVWFGKEAVIKEDFFKTKSKLWDMPIEEYPMLLSTPSPHCDFEDKDEDKQSELEDELQALEVIAALKEVGLHGMIPLWTSKLSSITLSQMQKYENMLGSSHQEGDDTQEVKSTSDEWSLQQTEFPAPLESSDSSFIKKEKLSPSPNPNISPLQVEYASTSLSPLLSPMQAEYASPSLSPRESSQQDEGSSPSLSPISSMQCINNDESSQSQQIEYETTTPISLQSETPTTTSVQQEEYFTLILSPQPEIIMTQLQQRESQNLLKVASNIFSTSASPKLKQNKQNRDFQSTISTAPKKYASDLEHNQPARKKMRDTAPMPYPSLSFQTPSYIKQYESFLPGIEDHTDSYPKKIQRRTAPHVLENIDQNFFKRSKANSNTSSAFFSTSSQPSSVKQNTMVKEDFTEDSPELK